MSNLNASRKLAACNPCRSSKLACDHVRPICGRCQNKGPAVICEYRTRPFKKRKTFSRDLPPDPIPRREEPDAQTLSIAGSLATITARQYPNPGYLGNSSHTTIFQNLPGAIGGEATHLLSSPNAENLPTVDDDQFLQATKLIEDICGNDLKSFVALIEYWIRQSGVNLPLAAAFVMACAQSTEAFLNGCDMSLSSRSMGDLVGKVFQNSLTPIVAAQHSTIDEFVTRFDAKSVRWETIGLFFTALSRASTDVQDVPPSIKLAHDVETLKRIALRYADRCLEICLSLDCLNDMQLVLQYENFINHSFVDGDQSYHSWKRLGDVISSIFALGYHETINSERVSPEFLVQLRESVVARAYSADKNVSIFLGRPPRMISKFCNFDFLEVSPMQIEGRHRTPPRYLGWTPNDEFDYTLDTWWSFICALLKEEVLDLTVEKDHGRKLTIAGTIEERAQARWLNLPLRYRYTGDLNLRHYKSIERDFIASARLNYLHILFMLRRAIAQNTSEPDAQLLPICAEILNLTAKIVIMKDRLTNSGTGLIWKICHYGLPAAGILCLSLLQPSQTSQAPLLPRSRILQDLGILVAHVDSGILIDPSDPDHALLTAATRAIQTILNKVLTLDTVGILPVRGQSETTATNANNTSEELLHWPWNETWDFEVDFWTTLVEHPTLNAGTSTTPQH